MNGEYTTLSRENLASDPTTVRTRLLTLERPCLVAVDGGRIGVADGDGPEAVWFFPSLPFIRLGALRPEQLGSSAFRRAHGVRFSYMAGAMAHGISSVELVTRLGQAGFLGSFGAAGLDPFQIEAALQSLKARVPNGPFAVNLIHSFDRPELEQATVDLCLRHGVRTVEASAFTGLEPTLVHYRAAGLVRGPDGSVQARHNLIVKLSRPDLARQMMQAPPADMLRQLVVVGRITADQADLASRLPVADDITVEADSGGHTDSRQLINLLPVILAIRDEAASATGFSVRVGAAGGLGTPSAISAVFGMGADYVVTGSINQACVEAGTSATVKALLARAEIADTTLAPAADMFELGSRVQVLKRGTLFPARARQLDELYQRYGSLEEMPAEERDRLERQVLRCGLDAVWRDVQTYFSTRDSATLERAGRDPRRRMALVFRWYLGQSASWAISGSREQDHQIWCGPAMGAFNAWCRGTSLAEPGQRHVAQVAETLMTGAAYLTRLQAVRLLGVEVPPALATFGPADMVKPVPEPAARPAPEISARAPAHPTAQEIRRFLARQIAQQAGLPPEEIDMRAPFDTYGLSSPKALIVLARLEGWLGRKLSQTLVWNFPTIEALSNRLAETP